MIDEPQYTEWFDRTDGVTHVGLTEKGRTFRLGSYFYDDGVWFGKKASMGAELVMFDSLVHVRMYLTGKAP